MGSIAVPTRRREGNACRCSLVVVVAIVCRFATTPLPLVDSNQYLDVEQNTHRSEQNANGGSTSSTMAVRRNIATAPNGNSNGDNNPPCGIAPSSQAGWRGRHGA